MKLTRTIATIGTAGALTLGGGALAAPAQAAGPVFTGGLVNVTVTDVANNLTVNVLNNANIGVAANVAANICDVNVGGILGTFVRNGSATCSTATQTVRLVQAQ